MALSIVNNFQHSPVTGASTTVKFGTAPSWTPTAGNTIVFGVSRKDATVSTVADTLRNVYNSKGTVAVVVSGGDSIALDVYECYHCLGGSPNIITVTFNTTATFPGGYLYEVSGTKSGDPTDIFATGISALANPISTSSFTTKNPNELVLAFMIGSVAGDVFTAGTGYTLDKSNFGSSGGVFWGAEHALFSSIQTGITASTNINNVGDFAGIAAIGIQAPLPFPNSLMMMGCGT